MMRHVTALFIVTLVINQIPSAQAEKAKDTEDTRSRAKVILAEKLGIDSDHPYIQSLRNTAAANGVTELPGRGHEIEKKKIVRHIIESKGIPFVSPNPEDLPAPPSREEILADSKAAFEQGIKQYKELATLEPIPPCAGGRTEHTSLAEVAKTLGAEIPPNNEIDYLFISAKFKADPTKFGEHTVINSYDPESKSAGSYAIKVMNVPCLPFRFRQTQSDLYYHLGDDALRRY